MMRFLVSLATLLVAAITSNAESPAGQLWEELKAKRDKLGGLHQEFDITQETKTMTGVKAAKRQLVLDVTGRKWREKSISGSGDRIRMFDGDDMLSWEEGSSEYIRIKRNAKEGDPVPLPYSVGDMDWSKGVEVQRRPCGLPGSDHQCVVLEAPLKRWMRSTRNGISSRLLDGTEQNLIDLETGLLLSVRTVEAIGTSRANYRYSVTYALKRMSFGAAPRDAALFSYRPATRKR